MIYFRRSPLMANRRALFGQTLHHLERTEALLEKMDDGACCESNLRRRRYVHGYPV